MLDTHFIVREPLLNNQERVLGYELRWQDAALVGRKPTEGEAEELVRFVGEQLASEGSDSLLGDQVLFLEVTPAVIASESLAVVPPRGTVLALHGVDIADGDAVAAITSARAKGYAISLRDADLAAVDRGVLNQLSYYEMPIGAPDFGAQVQQYRALNLPSLRLIARGVNSWKAYDLCSSAAMFSFVGQLHLAPRATTRARELNPAQAMILQLMDMVRKNADVRHLEGVLKRDAALSYKLLRYINSAGFGLGCEIQSLKHAVTMLGYSPLYRWLALLLATATTTGYSPVLMQTAILRGRFAELLGASFLPKHEAENLFVAGMFSLLDRLLGLPMEEVLEKIQLSEPVTQALLSREGVYGPFLALAEACELNSTDLESMATSLCIGTKEVNQAQLAALAWSQTLMV